MSRANLVKAQLLRSISRSKRLALLFHRPLAPRLVVPPLERLAFIITLFAPAGGDAQLYVAAFGENFEGHDGPALLLGFNEGIDFTPLSQQLTGPGLTALVDWHTTVTGDSS